MPTTLARELHATTLDELLTPLAALIADPREADANVRRILSRLAYLVSPGPARDGRGEFLLALNSVGIELFLEELSYDTTDGRPNRFRFGKLVNRSPGDLRAAFSELDRSGPVRPRPRGE